MLDAAVEESGYLAMNPVVKVQPRRIRGGAVPVPIEMEALADAFDARCRVMVLVGAYCGLRFGEVGACWHQTSTSRRVPGGDGDAT